MVDREKNDLNGPYDHSILPKLVRMHRLMKVSFAFFTVGVCLTAMWLVFLIRAVYADGNFLVVSWQLSLIGLGVGIIVAAAVFPCMWSTKWVDSLLPVLLREHCAACGYRLGRSLDEGVCPECGKSLLNSPEREKWVVIYEERLKAQADREKARQSL